MGTIRRMRDSVCMLLFAKAPVPGTVKTRLAKSIGDAAAAGVYRAMARHCIDIAYAAFSDDVEVWCTPDRRHPFFDECAAGRTISLRDQAQGGLGERMGHAFKDALERVSSALLMGTDVPSISTEDLRAAARSLQAGKDAVMIPTEDGGYGLIGLRAYDERAFIDIDWGTPDVMSQTRQRFSAIGWDWLELPVRWDVDEPRDLTRLANLPGFAAIAGAINKR